MILIILCVCVYILSVAMLMHIFKELNILGCPLRLLHISDKLGFISSFIPIINTAVALILICASIKGFLLEIKFMLYESR